MQDWTAFEHHSWARIAVLGQSRQVLRLAREKATVNEKVRFPGHNGDIPIFETETQTTLHARTEDYCRGWCPRSRNPEFGRDILQLLGTMMSIRAERASQASWTRRMTLWRLKRTHVVDNEPSRGMLGLKGSKPLDSGPVSLLVRGRPKNTVCYVTGPVAN